jgi:predicted nucleotidyltransferase
MVFPESERVLLSTTEIDNEIMLVRNKLVSSAIDPCSVILFGSASNGMMTTHSDIDLLLICKDATHVRICMDRLIPYRPLSTYPVDLIWMTISEFQRKKDVGGIAYVANHEGQIILGEPT